MSEQILELRTDKIVQEAVKKAVQEAVQKTEQVTRQATWQEVAANMRSIGMSDDQISRVLGAR
jgi:hypothetical protein